MSSITIIQMYCIKAVYVSVYANQPVVALLCAATDAGTAVCLLCHFQQAARSSEGFVLICFAWWDQIGNIIHLITSKESSGEMPARRRTAPHHPLLGNGAAIQRLGLMTICHDSAPVSVTRTDGHGGQHKQPQRPAAAMSRGERERAVITFTTWLHLWNDETQFHN